RSIHAVDRKWLGQARQCPLWVRSRHRGTSNQCPLYPRKRTLNHYFSKCAGATWPISGTEEYRHARSTDADLGKVWAFALEQRKADWSKTSPAAKARLVDPE